MPVVLEAFDKGEVLSFAKAGVEDRGQTLINIKLIAPRVHKVMIFLF